MTATAAATYLAWRIRCCGLDEFRGWYDAPMPYSERPGLTDFCDEADGAWCLKAVREGRCAHPCNLVKYDDIEEVIEMSRKEAEVQAIVKRLEPFTVDPESARRWREHIMAVAQQKRQPVLAGRGA